MWGRDLKSRHFHGVTALVLEIQEKSAPEDPNRAIVFSITYEVPPGYMHVHYLL